MTSDGATQVLADYYAACFHAHGACARGVDWPTEEGAALRHGRMLQLILDDPHPVTGRPTAVLDAGCGYGALLDHLKARGVACAYEGLDVVPTMVAEAARRHPEARFRVGDLLTSIQPDSADYVVCNGVLTQKRELGDADMERFVRRVVTTLFAACRRGLAFNLMTSKVNYRADTLFYLDPREMLGFCLDNLTTKVRIDHGYDLYEYTVLCYRAPEQGNIR